MAKPKRDGERGAIDAPGDSLKKEGRCLLFQREDARMKMRRLFPLLLITALSTASLAFGQTDTPVGDDPDPDALARVAKSGVVDAATGGQVLRSGDHFVQDGHTFVPKGTNFELHGHPWSLWPNYNGQTAEVEAELDRARKLGANVIRVFLTGDNFGGIPAIYDVGPKDPNQHVWESALSQLDDFLARADGHGLKVLLTLYDGLNGFRSVNGVCRGQIGNPSARGEQWDFQNTSPDSNANTWYHGPDIRPFRNHADEILTHPIPNTGGRVFANDPRIFGWDVMNEPDHLFTQPTCAVYWKDYVNAWIGWMARHVRIYTQAPITAGTYGWFLNTTQRDRPSINFDRTWMEYTTQGTARSLWYDLDFISIHWYQPVDRFQAAITTTKTFLSSLISGGKPVMMEEIGQADNGWYQVGSTCYQQSMPGCNGNLSCNRSWIHNWTASWTSTAKTYGVGSLVWTGSDFVWTASCANGGESNQDFFGFFDGGGVLKPTGQAYAPAGADTACTRASFRTRDGAHWLTAQYGGGPGSYLDASSTYAGTSSIFNLVRSGDAIGLKIYKNGTWYYASANQGGGSFISVDRTQFLQWESFGLAYLGYVSGLGDNGVAFRTWGYNGTPYYFSATNGGGGSVNADRTWILPWETFQMVCQGYSAE
jgi:hypothetical protein